MLEAGVDAIRLSLGELDRYNVGKGHHSMDGSEYHCGGKKKEKNKYILQYLFKLKISVL